MRGWVVMFVVLGACAAPDDGVDDTDDSDPVADTDTDTDTDGDTDDTDAADTGEVGHVSRLTGGPPVVCLDPEDREAAPATVEVLDVPPPPREGLAGGGVAVGDVDGDGDLDLVGALYDRVSVWRQQVARTFVRDVPWRIDETRADAGYVAVVLVDADDDGDLDAFATGRGVPRVLLRNDGSGVFEAATGDAGLGFIPVEHGATGQAWSDIDGDGDLDGVVGGHGPLPDDVDPAALGPGQATHLLLNDGDGTFTNATSRIPAAAHDGWTMQPVFLDGDGDGDDDLFLANMFGEEVEPSRLLWNDGGSFRLDGGVAGWDDAVDAGGAVAADVDGDGREDLVVAARGRMILRASGLGWADVASVRGLQPPEGAVWGFGPAVGDLDADGRNDVAVAFGHHDVAWSTSPAEQPDLVALQGADGRFVDARAALRVGSRAPHRNLLLADVDRDGWLDAVALGLDGKLRLGFAHCGEASWIVVGLRQDAPNTFAVGATITARAGDRSWTGRVRAGSGFGAGGPPEVHLGLGDVRQLDELVVRWPDGEEERWRGVIARRHLVAERP